MCSRHFNRVMVRRHHIIVGFALFILGLMLSAEPGRAHKPITSPFTYNDDVFPILRDRCARCHVPEGVAPMSLMTYDDTVPWGESIRVELLSGHMPPWSVDAAPTRFRNAQSISAREMNVLLTWATGGTPFGSPDKTPPPVAVERRWALGTPDLELPLPNEFTLPANKQEEIVEFVVPTGFSERRWLRAVELAPGTPAMVRSAIVQIKSTSASDAKPIATEPVLALWLPGDDPIPVEDDAAFEVPPGAELSVRMRYKKTWQYERKELRDRSTLGLYFAKEPTQPVRAIELTHDGPALQLNGSRRQFSDAIPDNVRAVAIYATDHPANAGIVVTAVAPDGSRRELIAFHPQRDWARRFWFKEPIALERGTKLETTISFDDETPALPLSQGPTSPQQDSSTVRLTLNVISTLR
jgi:hypothetical protein